MKNYITPNDPGITAQSDSISIQNAVDEAKKCGADRVVIPRMNERTGKPQWDVDKAIRLCSDLEVILDNCYIRQIDRSMDNVFINHDHDNPDTTIAGEQQNIRIIGKGNAVIDGGEPNGLSEFTSLKDGMPHISKNNPILLHNVRGLVIDNITIRNQRWWGINLLYVEKAKISNINIDAMNNMRNQDGIDLRIGCHDIIIENIWGQAGDDLIALSGFWGGRESDTYAVEGKSRDIHDIIIKNVIGTSADCTVIALRNTDGVKLYNVTIDSIYDSLNGVRNEDVESGGTFYEHGDNYRRVGSKSPYAMILVGQHGFFRERSNLPGEVYGLKVSNIHARCNKAIRLNTTLQNSHFSNIYGAENVTHLITTSTGWEDNVWGIDMKNVVFENIFFPNAREDACAFDFRVTEQTKTLDNVFIRNAFVGNCKTLLNMEHEGSLVLDGICSDNPDAEIINKNGAKIVLNGKTC